MSIFLDHSSRVFLACVITYVHISERFVILHIKYCVVMDNYSKELLKSWDLDILIKHFEENCIDKDSIANLTSDLIKELIPQIGLRIKFSKKWQEHFNKVEDVTNKQNEDTNLNTTHSIYTSSDEEINNEGDNKENLVNKKNCSIGSSVFRKLQRPSVKNILKLTAQGRAILKSYERRKTLSRKCRSTINDETFRNVNIRNNTREEYTRRMIEKYGHARNTLQHAQYAQQ
ncbi:uncharacterized protein LOC115237645 [Formica exsecta]|uniref:uncharacterized protein LOC115237645 n=1 Tax=Formica exsecta TaxID=72781 RepID=UPI001142C41E|nr:uncharacterized protein LOC115237645 [Formica exsecta]